MSQLRLFRRHHKDCPALKLKEANALKKRGKLNDKDIQFQIDTYNCTCLISFTGRTANASYRNQSTGLRNWAEAVAHVQSLENEGKDQVVHGFTLAHCITEFKIQHERIWSKSTKEQYTYVLEKFRAFAADRNIFFIREVRVPLTQEFKFKGFPQKTKTDGTEDQIADGTLETYNAKLRHFLSYAFKVMEWIDLDVAARMPLVKSAKKQVNPYDDDELDKILATSLLPLKGASAPYATKPKTFNLLLRLMEETGLRVSDTVCFHPADCAPDEEGDGDFTYTFGAFTYTFSMHKNIQTDKDKKWNIYVTAELLKEINECEWLSPTHPFAYLPIDQWETMTYAVRNRMNQIGKQCGVQDCRPHRIRHTFANRFLYNDGSIEDLSKLMCHESIQTTEKAYNAWVPKRARRLKSKYMEHRTRLLKVSIPKTD